MCQRLFAVFKRLLWIWVVGFVLVASRTSVAAQGVDANISGRVTDQTGGILPGVSVTVTGPSLLVPEITAITNELGEYRVSPLPVGLYTVTFGLDGFRSVRREDIRLTVGFTARVDVELGVGGSAETVTVVGQSPVVDVAATNASTVLTTEFLDLSAVSRNNGISLLQLAPGVRTHAEVGSGQYMFENAEGRAHGVGGQQWFTIDGMSSRGDFVMGTDFSTLEEVRLTTLGSDAESPTRGVQMSAVIKSGGNEFHGGGYLGGSNAGFQGSNLDDDLRAIGISQGDALDEQYDVRGDLGGPIVRDKVWFYAAMRQRKAQYEVTNSFKPDGSPALQINKQRVNTSKITYQASPRNRLSFLNIYEYGPEEKSIDSVWAYESREIQVNRRSSTKGQWEGTLGGSTLVSLQGSYLRNGLGSEFVNNPQILGRWDLETEAVTGDWPTSGNRNTLWGWETKGSVTQYKSNWGGSGNHEFKTGFNFVSEGNTRQPLKKDYAYVLLYEDGVPARVSFFNLPLRAKAYQNLTDVFLRDRWEMNRRLTLNLGFRYSHSTQKIPDSCRDAADFPADITFPAQCFDGLEQPFGSRVVPRVNFAYDVTGEGRTVVRGGYGQYTFRPNANSVGQFHPQNITYGIYNWRDLNGNNDWDLGETNRDRNGPDFIELTGNEFGQFPTGFTVNPDLKQVLFDELTFGVERQLFSDMSISATYVFSRTSNVQRNRFLNRPYEAYNIPVTNRDPGPDGRLGTGDEGELFTYSEYDRRFSGFEFERRQTINDPNADQSYNSLELTANKRMSSKWQLLTSFSATKKNIPYGARNNSSSIFLNVTGDNIGDFTPNLELNTADKTWDWEGKIVGSYILPYNIPLSVNYQHASGDPFARTVRFTGGRTIPAFEMPVEPIGSRRRPNTNLVTLGVRKAFALPKGHRVSIGTTLYNALNANTVVRTRLRSASNFLVPTAILPPRLGEFILEYSF
jgi:hypothetical protein